MHATMVKFLVLIFIPLLSTLQLPAQNLQAPGYKGIWFTLGQFTGYGDKYSGGLGTYTSSHLPVAIYCKAVDKTFFVYGGTTAEKEKHLLIMVSYYDHKKKRVPQPVIVYDKKGVDDPHDNASLSIDDSGYIHVFVSGRNTSRPGYIFKSVFPYQVTEFIQTYTAEITYPQPWFLKNNGWVCLFTRYTRGRELYWSSSKNGEQWQPEQKLAGMGGHYQVSGQHGQKLVTAFNYHPGGDVNKRTNIYLLQTNNNGTTWETIDGQPVEVPVTDTRSKSLVKEYEAEGKLVYLNDLTFDEQGNPVILAVVSRHYAPGPAGAPREWTLLHWKNGEWHSRVVDTSTHNYDMGSIYIDKQHWRIIGPTAPGPQPYGTGGEMVLWESNNNGRTWNKKKQLTHNSIRNHSYARRPVNAHDDFYAFWADGNAAGFSSSHLYYCDKKGSVYQLPYDMQHAFEKPVRLK